MRAGIETGGTIDNKIEIQNEISAKIQNIAFATILAADEATISQTIQEAVRQGDLEPIETDNVCPNCGAIMTDESQCFVCGFQPDDITELEKGDPFEGWDTESGTYTDDLEYPPSEQFIGTDWGEPIEVPSLPDYIDSVLLEIGYPESERQDLVKKLSSSAKNYKKLPVPVSSVFDEINSPIVSEAIEQYHQLTSVQETYKQTEPEISIEREDDVLLLSVRDDLQDYVLSENSSRKIYQIGGSRFTAKGFYKIIQQKTENLQKIATQLKIQRRDFFMADTKEDAEDYLRKNPYTQKELAKAVCMSDRNMVRITNKVNVSTSHGVYPIKRFFTRPSQASPDLTASKIQELIKYVIEHEIEPLPDGKIRDKLIEEHGFSPSRVQINKYRNQLGIPTSRER